MEGDRIHAESDGHRDLVVIGASAGGVEVLTRVVKGLPADLRAAICIVLHISPGSPSMLAHILGRAGRLPCRPARDGERLRQGVILVAPPDHHLAIEDGHVRLTVGPRENGLGRRSTSCSARPRRRSIAASSASCYPGPVTTGRPVWP